MSEVTFSTMPIATPPLNTSSKAASGMSKPPPAQEQDAGYNAQTEYDACLETGIAGGSTDVCNTGLGKQLHFLIIWESPILIKYQP